MSKTELLPSLFFIPNQAEAEDKITPFIVFYKNIYLKQLVENVITGVFCC